jgi:hypothetical protein
MLMSASSVGIPYTDFKIIAFDRPIYEYHLNKNIDTDLYVDSDEETYHEWSWDSTSKFRNLIKNKMVYYKKSIHKL